MKFAEKIKNVKEKLRARLSELKTKGCRIVGYGAPAKSTTLLHYLDIAEFIDYVVDDSNLKTYRYTPNTNLFIYPTEQIYETGISYDKDKDADVILILAWNFAESIMKNNEKFRSLGGKFNLP